MNNWFLCLICLTCIIINILVGSELWITIFACLALAINLMALALVYKGKQE